MKKTVTLLVLISMLFSTVFLFTGCGDSSVKEIKTADDIKGASVGVQNGTTGDTFVSDYEADGTKVMRYSKGADAIVALTQNKIDCVVIDSEPAKEFVKANAGLKILDEPFAEEEYAICISKENHELTEKIDKALAELKDEGVLDKIKSYYIEGNTDTVPYESPKDIKYDGELHMATNAAFPPYEYVEGGKIVGLDPMMATAICDKLGKKLVIDDMEFDSVITAVQTGKDDFGMAGMTEIFTLVQQIDDSGRTPTVHILESLVFVHALVMLCKVGRGNEYLVLGQLLCNLIRSVAVNRHSKNTLDNLGGVFINNPLVSRLIPEITINDRPCQMLACHAFGLESGLDFAACVSGVVFVHDIAKRGKIIVSSGTVHTVIDGNETDTSLA